MKIIKKKMGEYLTHVWMGKVFVSMKAIGKKPLRKILIDFSIFKKKKSLNFYT